MIVINRLDFYWLLQNNIQENLNELYILLTSSAINNNEKTKKINLIHMKLLDDLKLRDYYSRRLNDLNLIEHEIVLIIQNKEQILFDMFRKPRLCNNNNIKFIKIFLTTLKNYIELICSFETTTQMQYIKLYNTLDVIFKNVY